MNDNGDDGKATATTSELPAKDKLVARIPIVQPRDIGAVSPPDPDAPVIKYMELSEALEEAEKARKNGYGDIGMGEVLGNSDITGMAIVMLGREVERLRAERGCLLSGPGRGDCEHFVGLPKEIKFPETGDEYGRPHGWCQVCWDHSRMAKNNEVINRLCEDNKLLRQKLESLNKIWDWYRNERADLTRWMGDKWDEAFKK